MYISEDCRSAPAAPQTRFPTAVPGGCAHSLRRKHYFHALDSAAFRWEKGRRNAELEVYEAHKSKLLSLLDDVGTALRGERLGIRLSEGRGG